MILRQRPGHGHKNSIKETCVFEIHHNYYISISYKNDTPSSTVLVVEVVVLLLLTWPPLSFYSVLCASQVHLPQHPSRGDIDAALEWRLLFDIDAPLWYYMQIDRDEGGGCLMCKWWFWGTANVHTTAFLLIAFPVESRNFIRERINVSLKRTGLSFHGLNQWRM